MSRCRQLDKHLRALMDIGEVLGAMKNLALMEIAKLSRVASTQRRAVDSAELAIADLTRFYPELLVRPSGTLYLAIGSERGLCGDLNEAVAQTLHAHHTNAAGMPPVVAVGRRLWAKLSDGPAQITCLEGASVTEEVETTLARVMRACESQRSGNPASASLTVLHCRPDEAGISVSEFTPFRRTPERSLPRGYPPHLNVAPASLLPALVEQYLFAALYGIFIDSLLAENIRRLRHMENALRRLEQRTTELRLKRNLLRQEEITEEIEIIMVSAAAIVQRPKGIKAH